MALKKNSDRTRITLSVSKTANEQLKALARQGYRPVGRMFDIVVNAYYKNRIGKDSGQ